MEKSFAKRIALYACVGNEEVRRLRRKIDALEKGMIHAYHTTKDYAQLEDMYCTRDAPYWVYMHECDGCGEVAVVHEKEEEKCPFIYCTGQDTIDCCRQYCVYCVLNSSIESCVVCKDTVCVECHGAHACFQE